MAYQTLDKTEETEEPTGDVAAPTQPGQVPALGAVGGGTAGVGGGGGAGVGAATTSGKRPGFAGFDRYFAGNRKGAANAAANVASEVGKVFDTTKAAGQGDLSTQVGNIKVVTPTTTYVEGNEGRAPMAMVTHGTVAGPQALKFSSGVMSQFSDAGQQAADLRDNAKLQNYFLGSTPGGSRLDAALAGAAGGPAFDQVDARYRGLSDWFSKVAPADFAAARVKAETEQDLANKQAEKDARAWEEMRRNAIKNIRTTPSPLHGEVDQDLGEDLLPGWKRPPKNDRSLPGSRGKGYEY